MVFDFSNIEPDFFKIERYLEKLVMDLAEKVADTLLSYECYNSGNNNALKTCFAIMQDGYIFIRSRPDNQICVLDLFVSGIKCLDLILLEIRSLFMLTDDSPTEMKWAIKLRGPTLKNYYSDYMKRGNLGRLLSNKNYDLKREVSA